MATPPLFVENRKLLLSRLRLSGVSAESDAQCQIDSAVEWARLEIYERAGEDVITTVLGFTSTTTPTTAEERRRRAAELWEIELIRCQLLEKMPVVSADASADHRMAYNQEGIWRHLTEADRLDLLERCKNSLRDLEKKVTLKEATDEVCVRTSAIGAEECNAQPQCRPPLNPATYPLEGTTCVNPAC